MAVTNALPKNTRRLQDVGLNVSVALPGGGNTVNTNWLNMAEIGATQAYWNNTPAGFYGSNNAPAGTNTAPAGPYAATERTFACIAWTASTNGNNGAGSNITVTWQFANTLANGTPDATNAFNVPWRQSSTTTGTVNLTNGAVAAGNLIDSIPPWTPQFMRLSAVGGANGGNAGDATISLSLLF